MIGHQKVSKLFKVATVDFGQHAGKLIAGRRDASVGHKEPDPIGRFGRDRGESILAKLTFAGGFGMVAKLYAATIQQTVDSHMAHAETRSELRGVLSLLVKAKDFLNLIVRKFFMN